MVCRNSRPQPDEAGHIAAALRDLGAGMHAVSRKDILHPKEARAGPRISETSSRSGKCWSDPAREYWRSGPTGGRGGQPGTSDGKGGRGDYKQLIQASLLAPHEDSNP